MHSLLRIHFKTSKKQARRSLDSDPQGQARLVCIFPHQRQTHDGSPLMTVLLEDLPTSHTHVLKEVSNSTAHASLSSLRSDRAQVKSLLYLAES